MSNMFKDVFLTKSTLWTLYSVVLNSMQIYSSVGISNLTINALFIFMKI